MEIELLTRKDLQEFREQLIDDIRVLLSSRPAAKPWLRSSEVRKLLNISTGTLQTLRVNKTLAYTRIGGILYYATTDIEKMLEANKANLHPAGALNRLS